MHLNKRLQTVRLLGMTFATLGSTLMIAGVATLADIVFAEHYNNPGAFTVNQFAQMGLTLVIIFTYSYIVKTIW